MNASETQAASALVNQKEEYLGDPSGECPSDAKEECLGDPSGDYPSDPKEECLGDPREECSWFELRVFCPQNQLVCQG